MFLLDTNVVSELRKVRAGSAPKVSQWAGSVDSGGLYLSVITVQELEIAILLIERRDARQGAVLRMWMESYALPAFAGRILAVDSAAALQSARFHAPNPRPVRDALMAATAKVHGLTMVTRNVDDFAGTGVATLNPWKYSARR